MDRCGLRVEDFADLAGEGHQGIGLLNESNAWVQHAIGCEHIGRVPGGEQHAAFRTGGLEPIRQFLAPLLGIRGSLRSS